MKGSKYHIGQIENTQMILKKYLDIRELCDYTTLSRSSIYKLIKESSFPTSYENKHLSKRVFWLVTEVDKWFEETMVKSNVDRYGN